jgi:hypothetical protein
MNYSNRKPEIKMKVRSQEFKGVVREKTTFNKEGIQ